MNKTFVSICIISILFLSSCVNESGRDIFGDIPPGYYSEPKEIQKNRFYTQSLKKEDARRGGDTFCNKLQKKLLILEEYKSENYYSLIFECN